MKRYKIFGVLMTALALSSCKGFLDVTPSDKVEANTGVQNATDAKFMINGIMRNLTSINHYGRNFQMYSDIKGGDFTIYSQGRGLDGLYTFNQTATTGNYSGFWSTMFNNIAQINNLLSNINKLQEAGSMDNFDVSKGQALTTRAMLYFDLVRLYGKSYTHDKGAFGVPNITEPLPDNAQPLRATVEQNYKQILQDLVDAAPLLSKSKTPGYINYYANKALEARVHLQMNNLPAALAAAEIVINSKVYSLYGNEAWVSSWGTQFGTESIFELGVFPDEMDQGSGSPGFYLRRKGDGGGTVSGWFMASDGYLARLKEDPTDIRWGVMSYDESSSTRLGACYKYSGGLDKKGDGKSTATAVNIKVIRLSELYLIAAEAALPTDKTKAANYLNQIRKRSPALAPATAASVTLDMILNEKSKELFAEGQRYWDMIRLDKSITYNDEFPGITVPHRPKTIDRTFYKYILPLPVDELNANPGLFAQQNPGY